jgi:hypothetical protein
MIGQIDLKRRQETSYNDVSVRILKSGLQKYARRGMLARGLWCLVELDLFALVESDPEGAAEYLRQHDRPSRPQQKARALRTNLLNRLIVMVSEEVSIAAWWLPLVIDRLAEAWRAQRDQAGARKFLVDAYKHLCAARKIRLISDLKSTYLLPPDYVSPSERADLRAIHADLLESLGLAGRFAGGQAGPDDLVEACTGDLGPLLRADRESKRIVNGILYHLKEKSDLVFFWLNELIERQRDPQGVPKFGGRGDVLAVVWRLLQGFAEKREGLWGDRPRAYPANFGRLGEVLAVLRKWYATMTHQERPVYLYHAILLVVRRDQIDWHSAAPVIDTPPAEVEALYGANLSGVTIELDDFIADIHAGRRSPDALVRFAREGAHVENEERALRHEDYRRIYLALKERLDVYRRGGLSEVATAFGGGR